MKTHRADVYQAISAERYYQIGITGDDASNMSVGEEILLAEEYLAKARALWTADFEQPEIDALHNIRKVAAILVRCMEHHGAPVR